jgi:hypothetical protein
MARRESARPVDATHIGVPRIGTLEIFADCGDLRGGSATCWTAGRGQRIVD